MASKKLIRSEILPYHVTARVNNRERFPLPLAKMWEIFELECSVMIRVYEAEIQSFVMMPNHFHMIVTTPTRDLGVVMNPFMSSVTKTANLLAGRTGHLFGGPYRWSLINGTRYFGHAYKYVYRNPVRAGLCEQVEEFPFSTLHGLIGSSPLQIPLFFTRAALELGLPAIEASNQLGWLNRPFPKEAEELIRRGLRKKHFESIRDRKTRAIHPLLEQQL